MINKFEFTLSIIYCQLSESFFFNLITWNITNYLDMILRVGKKVYDPILGAKFKSENQGTYELIRYRYYRRRN